ncbi:hypothetical protein ACJIZ3_008841 [Penstemon smallii]|uniref:Transmembrane protein n=1 Tax=Penstemon smallii TaxID=265156 RepID=A0ABD3TBQ8_9LAMI
MAGPQNSVQGNPILAFFSNFLSSIKLPFPFPQKNNNNDKKIEVADFSSSSGHEPITNKLASVSEDETAIAYDKPDVTFPRKSDNLSSLKLESVDAERSTNPLILWQVYAIGGFFVLRWAWTRWNELKGQKKSNDDDDDDELPPPSSD